MRPAVAECLAEAAESDESLVLVVADGHALGLSLKAAHPERFIDVGIAEATLVGVAAGIARTGRRVVAAAMAPFLTRRATEQVRNDVCNAGLPVTFIGVGGGLGYGTLGPTHHAPEDLVTFANMPHTQVFCPADAPSAAWAVRQALSFAGPAYVRLGARADRLVFEGATPRDASQGDLLRGPEDTDVLLISAGATVAVALDAVDELTRRGVTASVLALTLVSPFPESRVRELASRARVVCVVEEHLRSGGIGEATARVLADRQGSMCFHSVDNRYPPVAGREDLFTFYGIDVGHVVESVTAELGNQAHPPTALTGRQQ
ncbi:transketolase C-terminal domain-containing protein [Streptomyces sp. NPDC050388]|uniref:transketolase family protein n=1 Tax=Streptomyces sp. NPDC050388 TaxID=3155781 RepID=UPI003417EDB3